MVEELREHQATAPGVNQRMMMTLYYAVIILTETHQAQTQQRGVGEVEALMAFGGQQRLQLRFRIGTLQMAQVDQLRRRRHIAIDNLVLGTAVQVVEGGPEHGMALDHGVPGRPESLEIYLTAHFVLVLHQVNAAALLQQTVQQDAFLHWRQGQDILNIRGIFQGIQLRLVKTGQRHIRRRQAANTGSTLIDKSAQRFAVKIHQTGHPRLVEARPAVGPIQL